MRQSAWKRDSKVAPRVQALGFRVEGLGFPVRKTRAIPKEVCRAVFVW